MLPKRLLTNYELEHLHIETILFQTGYLTIKSVINKDTFTLSYPNQEVRTAFLEHVYDSFSHHYSRRAPDLAEKLEHALEEHHWQRFIDLFNSLLASIPYQLYDKETKDKKVDEHENYYHSLFHATMSLVGQPIQSEVSTYQGRIDSVIQTPKHVFIFEFKRDDSLDSAESQVEEKNYSKAFYHLDKPIILFFIHFNSKLRQIDAFRVRDWHQAREVAYWCSKFWVLNEHGFSADALHMEMSRLGYNRDIPVYCEASGMVATI